MPGRPFRCCGGGGPPPPPPAPHPGAAGQALVASNDPHLQDEAVATLQHAVTSDPDIPDAYDQLAMAYGRKNDLADADLASAEAALSRGQIPTARQLASRAKGRFPIGSPGWVKADDIATLKPAQQARGPL